ncbi:hypothetical protein VM1G_05327 [Cytospora mali]|uniref:Uncharacterized protein n=1 Tax=Cytospora mali TaxID=578113 RepID=A0A194W0D4_CYTMA|nr:hypothetical protein VM1G_05327 [Valsa mali]
MQVICAWPVSGQYGPGSRILYYVLVAACVLGRQTEWLRSACLAAALLFPAVAALHGIVLTAYHVDGAVDMDIYGAFQLCAIGVLAGPSTVKLSKTYFDTPGRNMIFAWTVLILAGLLSLTVEFFRANPVSCLKDDFTYGVENTCGLRCSVDNGPWSRLRGGSTNNIYVILAPDMLPFGTATLLAAACCIPAVLSLVSMWDKILKTNWKRRFGNTDSMNLNKPMPGTNAATPAKMMKTEDRIRFYLSMVEIPVFGAAVVAILIVGERNFFSYRVRYETEPMASIGQWGPIVGTGLAALGSLYGLLAADNKEEKHTFPFTTVRSDVSLHHGSILHHHYSDDREPVTTRSMIEIGQRPVHELTRQYGFSAASQHQRQQSTPGASRRSTFPEPRAVIKSRKDRGLRRSQTSVTADGNRRKVAGAFEWLGEKLGTPAPDAFDDSEFQTGPAADFPTIPAEAQRNPGLPQIMASYNPPRNSQGHATPNAPLHRQRSGAGSFTESFRSGLYIGRASIEGMPSPSSHDISPGNKALTRMDTLEVPKPVFHSLVSRNASSGSVSGIVSLTDVEGSAPITKIHTSPGP